MKRKLVYVLFISFIAFPSFIYAQSFRNNDAEKIISGSSHVRVNEKNKSVQYIELRQDAPKAFSANHVEWLSKSLRFSNDHTLELISKNIDQEGFTHEKYQIHYKNIRVEGAVYSIHSRNGQIYSANGEYILGNNIQVIPQIKETDAFENAKTFTNATKYSWDSGLQPRPKGELVILPVGNNYVLSYKFDIYALTPLSRYYVFIDANSGKVNKSINRIQDIDAKGTAETMYNGIVNIATDSMSMIYVLRESGRGGGIETYNLNHTENYPSAKDFTDGDNYWDDKTDHNNAAYDAHFGAEATYDFYYNKFGRNSYDGNGAKLVSYIHYSNNYVNAFWNGSYMTYGDGDGSNYLPLTPIEVVAHEITHAFTEHTAGLIYAGESGALNESFSDIFGVTIDFIKNPKTANYLMGDAMSTTHTPFRSMQDPNAYGNPDTYKGQYWDFDEEVHQNSTVMSYWYYLLCEGGNGVNDLGNSYHVNGIGRDTASRIVYRNLTVYLTPSATYEDARFYSIKAAEDLYGGCSKQMKAVTDAWYAVGVGDLFNDAVTADFTVSAAEACTSPATIYFYNNSSKASSYLWDFGDGKKDTSENPGHTFGKAGSYTIRLIAEGSTLCNHNDTLTKANFITVSNSGLIAAPACVPFTINKGTGGIYQFGFNSINKKTGGSTDNYKDYSCTDSTIVKEGRKYSIKAKVGDIERENVYVWLDINNNGAFESGELLFKKENVTKAFSDSIIIPSGAEFNIPLRLRVASDYTAYPLKDACTNSNYGQIQDYTVVVKQNISLPEVYFISNKRNVISGDTVKFNDNSLNLPVSWQWSFPGGTPSISTLKSPKVLYDTPGTYDVTLTAKNAYGSDSITKSGFIIVTTPAPMGLTARIKNQAKGEVGLKWFTANENNLFEDFEDGVADNFVFSDSSFSVENGYLKLNGVGDLLWSSAYYERDYGDFTFEYKFKSGQSNNNYSIGSFVRAKGFISNLDGSGYFVAVLPSGDYSAWKLINGSAVNLIPWTMTNAVNTLPGSWNVVTLEAVGNNIKIYVNSQYVDEFSDDTYTSGKINVCAYFGQVSDHDIWWDYYNVITDGPSISSLHLPKAVNTLLRGDGDFTKPPVSDLKNNIVDVKGIIAENFQSVSNIFKYYNIYRNNNLLDSTKTTSYTDTVPEYGIYQYKVTSVYDAGESTPALTIANWADPTPGENCANAQNLAGIASPYYGTTEGYKSDFNFCNMGSAADRIFYIDVPSGNTLKIGQTYNYFDSRYSIRIGGSCPGNTIISCTDEPDIQTQYYSNTTDSIQKLYFILSGYESDSGNFVLEWELMAKSKPIANFSVSSDTVKQGTLVFFSDSTKGLPTSLKWSFPGGVPSTSLIQNPHVLYNSEGNYKVTLVATNDLGSDTITKESYITVGNLPGENCYNSQDLAGLTSPYSGSLEGYNSDFVICGTQTFSDRIFYIDVPAGNMLNIGQTAYNYSLHYSLRIGASCPGITEIVCSNGQNTQMHSYLNSTKSTQRAYFIIGNYYSSYSNYFTLEWNLSLPTKPMAGFRATDTVVSIGATIGFFDQSTGMPTSYVWYFQGGSPTISTLKNPSVIYNTSGTYNVKLVVKNTLGADSISKTGYITITLPPKPVAYFSANHTNIVTGSGVNFEDYSSNYPTSWKWTFTGGTPSTSASSYPYIVYNSPGIYNVKMVVTNLGGSDSIIRYGYITVKDPQKPVADFSSSTKRVLDGSYVYFYDNSSNSPTSWKWAFDGGSPSVSTSNYPSVQYNSPGTYNVKLIAINAQGSDTVTKIGYITVTGPQKPVADFYSSTKNIISGSYVYFYDNSLNFPTSWKWDFTGGNPSVSSLEYPYVMYNSPGTYDVKLIATNVNGSDTILKKGYITVSLPQKPIGNFYTYNRDPVMGSSVYFYDNSVNNPVDWKWTFPGGDPSSSESRYPNSIVYRTPGTFDVKLVVTNEGGSDTILKNGYIFVSRPDKPVADFSTNNTRVVKGNYIYFYDNSLNKPTAWQWTFTGGSPSSSTYSNPSVEYNTSGSYNVKLVVTNVGGSDTIIKTNYITATSAPKPVADFYTYNTNIVTGLNIYFYDNSFNYPTSWNWTFTGGTPATSTSSYPSVAYNSPGTYDVKLVAKNAQGSDTIVKAGYITVIIPPKPVAYFYSSSTNINVGANVYFYDNSLYYPTSWKWTFDGGSPSVSTLEYPSVVYNSPGKYDVKLVATNAQGSDSIIKYSYITVTLPPKPKASFYSNTTATVTGSSVYFYDNSSYYPTSWKWTFYGGNPSVTTLENPSVVYNSPGMYDVKLVATNGQGSDSIIQYRYITVTLSPNPISNFTITPSNICENGDIVFTSTSSGAITDFYWDFGEGANPSSANNEGPHTVTYSTPGTKKAFLILNSSFSKFQTFNVSPIPATPIINKQDSIFYSSSENGNQWYSASQGKIEGETNKIFKPLSNGEYFVIVTIDGCTSKISNIMSFTVSILEFSDLQGNVKVYPNPIKNYLVIEAKDELKYATINDLEGRLIKSFKLSEFDMKYILNLSDFRPGMYNLKLLSKKGMASFSIVKIE
jgi:PKD repeat protein